MMKRKVLFFSAVAIAATWIGCTYKKEVTAFPVTVTPACDTTNVRYSVEVKAVLTASCFSCHATPASLGGGITLDKYSTFKAYASSGVLMNSVMHTPGADFMPKSGGKISDCDIAILRTWIRNGMLNN